jgi:hypothetical protein
MRVSRMTGPTRRAKGEALYDRWRNEKRMIALTFRCLFEASVIAFPTAPTAGAAAGLRANQLTAFMGRESALQ